jgi:hypothetical protein
MTADGHATGAREILIVRISASGYRLFVTTCFVE